MIERAELLHIIFEEAKNLQLNIIKLDETLESARATINHTRPKLNQKLLEFAAIRNVLDEYGISHDFDEPELESEEIE